LIALTDKTWQKLRCQFCKRETLTAVMTQPFNNKVSEIYQRLYYMIDICSLQNWICLRTINFISRCGDTTMQITGFHFAYQILQITISEYLREWDRECRRIKACNLIIRFLRQTRAKISIREIVLCDNSKLLYMLLAESCASRTINSSVCLCRDTMT